LNIPNALAVDAENFVWVTDSNQIKKFHENGSLVLVINIPQNGKFYDAISAGPNNTIFVGVDNYPPHADLVLILDQQTGKFIRDIALEGNGNGTPSGFLFGEGNGLLYVLNSDSEFISTDHVQVYDIISGTLVNSFGGKQCNDIPPNYLCQPFSMKWIE